MVVTKFMRKFWEIHLKREGGGDSKLMLKSELEGGFWLKRRGVCGWEQDVMVWKRQPGSKKKVGGYGVCVGERETCWYKSSLSHSRSHISCVFFGGCGCARVFKRQEECVFVLLHYRGLITPQDAAAASGDLSAGGTLLLRESGFFSLWQDSHPQSHTGQDGRVRRWDLGDRGGGTGRLEAVWGEREVTHAKFEEHLFFLL